MTELKQLSTIIVYHKNYPVVVSTVKKLLASGVNAEKMLLVDNSESPELYDLITNDLPADVRSISIPNLGYGNAVNQGVKSLREKGDLEDFLLVATHEVDPIGDAIEVLLQSLQDDPSAAVIGPTLVTISSHGSEVWSSGGYTTRWRNIPRHFDVGKPVSVVSAGAPQSREWLDGACCIYKSGQLVSSPMREDYFLYFEETDYHLDVRLAGKKVLWCPRAVVAESAAGIPPYYYGRNLQKFQNRHGNRCQRLGTVPSVIGGRLVRLFQRRATRGELRSLMTGWLTGIGLRPDPLSQSSLPSDNV